VILIGTISWGFLAAVLELYGFFALSHILIQLVLASAHQARFRRRLRRTPEVTDWPSASVIVTAYNEEAVHLRPTLESILTQDYPNLQAICVDDGTNRMTPELRELYQEMSGRMTVLMLEQNVGKRAAQMEGLKLASGEVVVTMDSDTFLYDPSATRKLVRGLTDPKVGAVTGSVAAANRKRNLLTRVIALRYWNAFNQERAAQSLFGVVMCCSGPFSAYRRSFLDSMSEYYLAQRFLGQVCTFGDDRHLTNLALRTGWKVRFVPDAEAHTIVPETLKQYFRQQVRWNKSFYREALWTAAHVRRPNPYLWYDLIMQTVLPFLLLVALGTLSFEAATQNPNLLWQYGVVMLTIGLLRVTYGIVRTHDIGFILFSIFGFFYILVILPCRFYALSTFTNTGWGTR
jgi:hyaluronan synthase/N-acetylglucosaminyltransferase